MGLERFAVIGMPDGGTRIITQQPFLRHLPRKLADSLVKRMTPRVTSVVKDEESKTELGYILDLPAFFSCWNDLSPLQQTRQLTSLVKKLKAKNIRIISFPYWKCFFTEDAINYLYDNQVIVLDAFKIRMATLFASFKHLIGIIKNELPWMRVGIWTGDSDIGQLWTMALAPHFNDVVIGGQNKDELYTLADYLLKQTGLACQVTLDLNSCISGKNLMVFTEQWKTNAIKEGILFYGNVLNQEYMSEIHQHRNSISIESGWLTLPDYIKPDRSLLPWEVLGVLDGLLYVTKEDYRSVVSVDRIHLGDIELLHELFDRQGLQIQGFISQNKVLSFDRFRMHYFPKK